jgi:hypothetical protein
MLMKFKIELFMLLTAIGLFTVSTILYSTRIEALAQALSSYPYRVYAIPVASFGSVLMAAATVSYAKRSKNCP